MSENDETGKDDGKDDGDRPADGAPPPSGRDRPGAPQLDEDDFPRSRFKVSPQQVIPIFALLITLFAVITLRKGCADGVATMFKVMGPPDAGGVRYQRLERLEPPQTLAPPPTTPAPAP